MTSESGTVCVSSKRRNTSRRCRERISRLNSSVQLSALQQICMDSLIALADDVKRNNGCRQSSRPEILRKCPDGTGRYQSSRSLAEACSLIEQVSDGGARACQRKLSTGASKGTCWVVELARVSNAFDFVAKPTIS
jgi:hypothetical protein